MSSISGIGGAGSANAELAILLSKSRALTGFEGVSQGANLPELSGHTETTQPSAPALSGTGKVGFDGATLQFLTMMQADDGMSVAASSGANFAVTAGDDDIAALIARWSEGADTFSTMSNITIATQPEHSSRASAEIAAVTTPSVDYSFAYNQADTPQLSVSGSDSWLLMGDHQRKPEQDALMALLIMGDVAGGMNAYAIGPSAAPGSMADVSA